MTAKMEILFLGTGASEWDLENRKQSWYRRKSSVLINEDLLIDAGPEIFAFEEDFFFKGLFSNVKNILQTHSHRDHLSQNTLEILCKSGARNFYGDKVALDTIDDIKSLNKIFVCSYTPVSVGEYTVIPLNSNHGGNPGEHPLHYIIEKDDIRIFYGCDGAWLLYDTWKYIRKSKFDLMILDGTTGELDGNLRNFEHNNLAMIRLLAKTFRENKLLKENGKIMISHIARSLHGTHEELEKQLAGNQIIPALDGMKVIL